MPELEKIDSHKLRAYAALVKSRIDDYCVNKFTDEHRTHLGASIIGNECARYIWSSFRWLKHELFSAKMLRLFNDGKRAEPEFIEYLMAAGVSNYRQYDLTSEDQTRFSAINGHYGGSTDGLGTLAEHGLDVVIEMKTHNDKSFKNLRAKGVIVAKPQHYVQMCSYGKAFDLRYGLYIAKNKNDSDIEVEIVWLDHSYASDLTSKAFDIIHAKIPPPKIALQSTAFQCSYCVFQDICHRDALPSKNCRSCLMASPIDRGQWFCHTWNAVIPPEAIKDGCDSWHPVTKSAL